MVMILSVRTMPLWDYCPVWDDQQIRESTNMRQALRELKEDLVMLLSRVREMEAYQRDKDSGKFEGGIKDAYPRTWTGTFRGTQRELAEIPDKG